MNILILENIRSAHNVGSIFRTADAVGIDKIYLVGTTPTPTDRFGRSREDIKKTALGAEEVTPWEYKKDIDFITDIKGEGFKIISFEQDENSMEYTKVNLAENNIFIFGNEVEGISESVLNMSDSIAEIPMKGEKESLNVSVSVGVGLYGTILQQE